MPQSSGVILSSRANESGDAQIVRHQFDFLLANTTFALSHGFQFTCSETIDKTNILFQFPRPILPAFHMNNVLAPLDIAFIDQQGTIVNIFNMQVYQAGKPKALYKPSSPIVYALEAKAGYFKQMGIRVGDRVQIQ